MNVIIPKAGEFGYLPDAIPQELPPNGWSAVSNVRFRDGYAERFRGGSQILSTPTITPYWIHPYRTPNSRYWIYCGLTKAFCDDGAIQTELTPASPFTGAIDDRWTGGNLSGIMVINNGADKPHYWAGDTGNDFSPLTGWNSAWRAASLRPFKNYLVALDITKSGNRYGSMVKWSAAADPGTLPTSWDEADATKDAGEQDLAETPDFLIDALPMGDINVLYKERSMYAMQYIGGTFIWRFYRLPGEVGMLARGCAASTPKGHVVLTSGDLIIHSGQGPTSLATGRVRKWLFNSIDQTNYLRSFLCLNRGANEVWVCFPESNQTSCTLALVWNWESDTFSTRQLQNFTYGNNGTILTNPTATWASDSASWDSDTTTWNSDGFGATEDRLLMCGTTPLITLTETGSQFLGSDPTCRLERTGIAFDKPDTIKTVRSVVPRFDAVAGTVVSIQVGGAMDAESSPTWSSPVTYTVGTTRKADTFASGRFLSFRITSTSSQPWRLRSFDFEVEERGMY